MAAAETAHVHLVLSLLLSFLHACFLQGYLETFIATTAHQSSTDRAKGTILLLLGTAELARPAGLASPLFQKGGALLLGREVDLFLQF